MLTEGANTPMGHLLATCHKIHWLTKNSPHVPSCLISADKKSISIQGTPILLSDIPVWYQQLLGKAEVLLEKALLGLEFPEFDELITKQLDPCKPQNAFIDDYNKRDVGYSFLTDKKNGLQKFNNALLIKIFDTEKLNANFFSYDSDGNPLPKAGVQYFFIYDLSNGNIAAQLEWFNDVSKLIDVLFVGSHVGPGGVPRGTEAQTLSSVNVEECPRSLHVMYGYLTAVLRYNKTRHNSQMDKLIARFFPPRLGHLFLFYLVIIRPLEKIWAGDIFHSESKAPYNYRHLVFVRSAIPMQSADFSKVLFDSSLHYIKIGLGLRNYRQFIKAVLRVVLDIDYDSDEKDSIDASDASFGHSEEIGATYGLNSSDLPNLTGDLLRVHQIYCERVHQWLGEGKPLPEQTNPLSMTQITDMFNSMNNSLSSFATSLEGVCHELQSTRQELESTRQELEGARQELEEARQQLKEAHR